MSGPYFAYIAAAYAVTGLTVTVLVASAWITARARHRRLAELGDDG